MHAAPISSRPANENVRGVRLTLSITDPEVVDELEQRDEGPSARPSRSRRCASASWRCARPAARSMRSRSSARGSHARLRARGAIAAHDPDDVGAGRLLGGYLDPASGSLPQRLERLTRRDGEIESLLSKHLDGERSTVAQTLARQVGEESALFKLLSPTQAGGLVATLSAAIDGALRVQKEEVLRQFSLDRPDSALSRLVGDIASANGKLRGELAGDIVAVTNALSLDNEQGPLSRFVVRVEKAQRSILDEFSLDREGSAIRRLSSTLDDTRATVEKSLTLNDKTSPLSRIREELMGAVTAFAESNARFQSDVRATLATFRVRRDEAPRSSPTGTPSSTRSRDAPAARGAARRRRLRAAGGDARYGGAEDRGLRHDARPRERRARGARRLRVQGRQRVHGGEGAGGAGAGAEEPRGADRRLRRRARERPRARRGARSRRHGPDLLVISGRGGPATDVYRAGPRYVRSPGLPRRRGRRRVLVVGKWTRRGSKKEGALPRFLTSGWIQADAERRSGYEDWKR